jgi:hypothetical protein
MVTAHAICLQAGRIAPLLKLLEYLFLHSHQHVVVWVMRRLLADLRACRGKKEEWTVISGQPALPSLGEVGPARRLVRHSLGEGGSLGESGGPTRKGPGQWTVVREKGKLTQVVDFHDHSGYFHLFPNFGGVLRRTLTRFRGIHKVRVRPPSVAGRPRRTGRSLTPPKASSGCNKSHLIAPYRTLSHPIAPCPTLSHFNFFFCRQRKGGASRLRLESRSLEAALHSGF